MKYFDEILFELQIKWSFIQFEDKYIKPLLIVYFQIWMKRINLIYFGDRLNSIWMSIDFYNSNKMTRRKLFA